MQNPYVAATSAPSSMNIRPSSDTASHVNRQPTVPKASSASNIETATQPATQQNVQPDRAADADESGFDRKAALQVLQAVEAKCEALSNLTYHMFADSTSRKSDFIRTTESKADQESK